MLLKCTIVFERLFMDSRLCLLLKKKSIFILKCAEKHLDWTHLWEELGSLQCSSLAQTSSLILKTELNKLAWFSLSQEEDKFWLHSWGTSTFFCLKLGSEGYTLFRNYNSGSFYKESLNTEIISAVIKLEVCPSK